MFQTFRMPPLSKDNLHMNLSYKNIVVRDYCYSINLDLGNNRFTINEILAIRTYIADLRSAPSLADVPINYSLVRENEGQNKLIIQFNHIEIICAIISTIKNPSPSQIKRIQVLDIIRIDLHLSEAKAYLA